MITSCNMWNVVVVVVVTVVKIMIQIVYSIKQFIFLKLISRNAIGILSRTAPYII